MARGDWLNTTRVRARRLSKPCNKLKYCPYGQLVEEYPVKKKSSLSCPVFGHDCPAHYLAAKV